ncbi:MAG TPA: COX15/CtaA family protein, partial [Beutenbergiaceae bacterium]|nr:COX15/CtaA family protein [Beutenbergiaceae bacterium]
MNTHKATSFAVVTNLVLQVLIIITGGAVRLTDSGLGCSTWPMCEPGSFTPVRHEAFSIHPYIEFGNRVVSAVVVLAALVVFLLVWRQRHSRSRGFVALAAAPLIGVLAQAGIGG